MQSGTQGSLPRWRRETWEFASLVGSAGTPDGVHAAGHDSPGGFCRFFPVGFALDGSGTISERHVDELFAAFTAEFSAFDKEKRGDRSLVCDGFYVEGLYPWNFRGK